MNDEQARVWLIKTSLLFTSAAFSFFLLAPVFGYPLTWDQATRILQIILPVFLGYLGSASHFVFVRKDSSASVSYRSRPGSLFPLLVQGPVWAFAVAIVAAVVAFGYSNRLKAPPGTGMSVDTLAIVVAAALGILAATTSLILARLFSVPGEESTESGRENDT